MLFDTALLPELSGEESGDELLRRDLRFHESGIEVEAEHPTIVLEESVDHLGKTESEGNIVSLQDGDDGGVDSEIV